MIKGIMVGVFDLFHIGHLNAIKQAKSKCDFLIVGVHDDKLNIKGVTFYYNLKQRVEMVNAIKYVDEVIIYERVDLLLTKINFDIFFIGEDQTNIYFQNAIQWCNKNNKQIFNLKRTKGISSTLLRKYIKGK